MRLIAFPFGGGGASFYHRWNPLLPDWLELTAVQLPGRESRLRETPIRHWQEAAKTIACALVADADSHPNRASDYLFFGHSMGSLLAYEVTRQLRHMQASLPNRLILSGRRAPHLPMENDPIHQLPDVEFAMALIRRYNGIPKVILENAELLRLFLPTIRADIELVETYEHIVEPPLSLPIDAWGGDNDKRVPVADLRAWEQLTTAPVATRLFSGEHFYLQQHQEALTNAIVTLAGAER
jgi:medium-chain acyl-[acyl-carrier-protein] hydrolase